MYPKMDVTNEFGVVQPDLVKELVDKAYFDGKIDLGDHLSLTRTIDTEGQGITGINLNLPHLNISGSPDTNKYTLAGDYNIGNLGLGFGTTFDEGKRTEGEISAKYEYPFSASPIEGKVTAKRVQSLVDDYYKNNLNINTTLSVNDYVNLNLQGDVEHTPSGVTSALTPSLDVNVPYKGGAFTGSVSKDIVEGGPIKYGIGYSRRIGDQLGTDLYSEVDINLDPKNRNLMLGWKKTFAKGGLAKLLGE